MKFWESGQVVTLLLIAALLLVGSMVRRIGPIRRLGIPASILSGCLGLLLGDGLVGVLPLDGDTLEAVVYHGLALVFIAVSLQTPERTGRTGGAVSFALGIALLLNVQAVVGMAVVLLLGLHPGFGLLLPLGFEQGPGQALSLGNAWEATGLADGGQLGLIIAALGFGWAIGAGVPLAAWGRRRGLLTAGADASSDRVSQAAKIGEPGALDPLTRHLAFIGLAYLITYGIVAGLAQLFSAKPGIAAMAWGFHFIFGALVAMTMRASFARLGRPALDNVQLSRIAGFTVDVVTCAAIAAVQIAIFKANLFPLLLMTTAGGLVTALVVIWLAPRVFPRAPFEHCVLLFGAATGTLPVGLALLRIVDPDFRTPASLNAVLGSAMSVPLAAVFMMGILPFTISGWPDGYPTTGFIALGLFFAFALAILVGWWKLGPMRLIGGMTELWPLKSEEAG
ncbi:MAG: ESS family glutamate:Na+ symporter [Myxococcota bacterium]|jgi:ESS family glutamate:Na+ symporter